MKITAKITMILISLAFSMAMHAQDAIVYDYRLDEKALNDNKNPIPYEIRNSELFGKTINVFGASRARNHLREITDTWHCKLAQKYHMLYRNYARNNCCIAFDRRRERWSAPINEFYEDMDTCDYILLIGGHSDAEQIIKGNPADYEKYFTLDLWTLRQVISAIANNARAKAHKKMTVEKDCWKFLCIRYL